MGRATLTMASVTTKMTALEHSTLAACAMVPARSTSVDAPTFQPVTATVTATSSTRWASVVGTALRTKMLMASAMTKTLVLANTTSVASATGLEKSTNVAVPTFQPATATAMEIN